MKRLWIVGKRTEYPAWEFQGIFSNVRRAIAECAGSTYFVAPVILDESIPAEKIVWPGAFYPHLELTING